MRTGYFYLSAALLASVWPATSARAQVTRTAIAAQQQARQVKIAFLIGAEQTRREVARSDAVIQALYKRLDMATAQIRTSLRRANLSDQERRRLQGELGRLRDEQDGLITQLAAKDVEYAASIRAYREGLSGLLSDNDPRILALLERVADGDASAADELQDLTRIIRKAREAGLRARNAADQRGVAIVLRNEKDRGRKTTAQVLAAWQEAADIDADDFWQWIYIARLQQEAGKLEGASKAVGQATTKAGDKRQRGVAVNEFGNVALQQGRLDDARAAYEEFLKLSRELLTANPSSAEARRDVGIGLSKIGEVAATQGRLDEARSAYDESLSVRRALLSANPGNAEVKRDAALSLSNVGDIAVAEERLADARVAYEESLAINRALLSANSNSVLAKRDVSIGLSRVGYLALLQARLADARSVFEESLVFDRSSLAANPSSAEAKRDVSVSLNLLGKVAIAQGRPDDARAVYEESLSLSRSLLSSNPSNAEAKRDVAVSLSNVGDAAVAQRRLGDARKAYEELLSLSRELQAANPTSAEAKRDVMIAHQALAGLPQGETHLRDALAIAEAMARDGTLAPNDRQLLETLRADVKALEKSK